MQYPFKCVDGHTFTAFMHGQNLSQSVATSKAGVYRVDTELPFVPRETECNTCGKKALELTREEAGKLGLLTFGAPAVYFNYLADD